MIHPTRTNLLRLREKTASVTNSVSILKARRQALIREFLASVGPFVRSRDAVKRRYELALEELHLTEGHEGAAFVEALAATSERDVGAEVEEVNLMGVRYRDLTVYGPFVRTPAERDHGYAGTTPHLDESIHVFESIVEAMLEIATFESKVKTLGEETLQVTRRTRVLEERVLPGLESQVRAISQYLGEREREAYFRLKKFKDARARRAAGIRRAGARER
jgi:V/A-type H+-transporting ATPase subunit D